MGQFMSSIEQSGLADWQRLFNSGIRQTRQAFLLGACLADREKWIESVKRVGNWSYEFQPLVEMLTGDLKPTPVNVANSKRRLNLSDKSPRTILEQCAIWLRIAVLEITRDELEYCLTKTVIYLSLSIQILTTTDLLKVKKVFILIKATLSMVCQVGTIMVIGILNTELIRTLA